MPTSALSMFVFFCSECGSGPPGGLSVVTQSVPSWWWSEDQNEDLPRFLHMGESSGAVSDCRGVQSRLTTRDSRLAHLVRDSGHNGIFFCFSRLSNDRESIARARLHAGPQGWTIVAVAGLIDPDLIQCRASALYCAWTDGQRRGIGGASSHCSKPSSHVDRILPLPCHVCPFTNSTPPSIDSSTVPISSDTV